MGAAPLTYAALGDSSSQPASSGRPSFADRLAGLLGVPRYANLARFGVRAEQVAADQLPRALELRPSVATVACGANDILRDVATDWNAVGAAHDAVLGGLVAAGTCVVVVTYPDFTAHLPMRERTRRAARRELDRLNAHLREAAARHGALLADCAAEPGSGDATMFLDDGLHASEAAAVRLSDGIAALLGRPAVAA